MNIHSYLKTFNLTFESSQKDIISTWENLNDDLKTKDYNRK